MQTKTANHAATVLTTSEWAQDNARGAAYAETVIADILEREALPKLGHTVMQMMGREELTGFEVGFFHHISARLSH